MDSKAYFQLVNSQQRRGHSIPLNRYRSVGEHFLGFSISDTEPRNSRMISVPQGSLYSSRQLQEIAQAQFFRHLPPNFVQETIQHNGTKYSGG